MCAYNTKTEKEVLEEVLDVYRKLPSLWDPNHEKYTNKPARSNGFAILLRIYKKYVPEATMTLLKKRLINMRTAYRREQRKISKALQQGLEHKPNLWYFKKLSFLNEDGEFSGDEIDCTELEIDDNEEYESNEVEGETSTPIEDQDVKPCVSPPPKKPRPSAVYLNEDYIDYEDIRPSAGPSSKENTLSVMDSFGRTIGLQLKELEPLQRFIAERLIAETIFLGRLNKLEVTTSLLNRQ